MADLRKQVEELLAAQATSYPLRWALALLDGQYAAVKADAEIEEMWRQKVTQLEAENATLRKASARAAQLHAENERLLEVAKMARRFAAYAQVLEVLATEDRKLRSINGWGDLDPVLGAKGQVLTMGDFRLLAAAIARADAKETP